MIDYRCVDWMRRIALLLVFAVAICIPTAAAGSESLFRTNVVAGWTVLVNERLFQVERDATERAVELIGAQLREIERVVPAAAVAKLREVTLWVHPEYSNVRPTAEYHPDARWLREHGRDERMARGIEFTNVRIFEAEARRMPSLILHELAHAFHDRFLPGGFGNGEIRARYEAAKAGGAYEKVERWTGERKAEGRERAYAMTNPMEYFAELTEAFFGRNDFFPFDRAELKKHDSDGEKLLGKLWGVHAD